MPIQPAPLPRSLCGRVFTVEEAIALGVDRRRLGRSDLVAIGHGLRAPRGAPITEAAVVAAYCRIDSEVEAWGETAARLWGLPLPDLRGRRERRAVVLMRTPRTRRRRDGRLVAWVHLGTGQGSSSQGFPDDGESYRRRDGARLPSPAVTFASLASLLEHDELVEIGDHLVRRPRRIFEGRDDPLAMLDQLHALAAGSFAGAPRLRKALADVRQSADSPMETRLRLACIRAGLPEPLANRDMVVDGERLGQPDLWWPDYGVCAEYDGAHHLAMEQRSADVRLGERRRARGIEEIRVLADQMRAGARPAVARISAALRAHGWRG